VVAGMWYALPAGSRAWLSRARTSQAHAARRWARSASRVQPGGVRRAAPGTAPWGCPVPTGRRAARAAPARPTSCICADWPARRAGGSGSAYIYGFCDKHWRAGMSEADCHAFVVRAVSHAMARDGSSGGARRRPRSPATAWQAILSLRRCCRAPETRCQQPSSPRCAAWAPPSPRGGMPAWAVHCPDCHPRSSPGA
jgi:hypothetical protein